MAYDPSLFQSAGRIVVHSDSGRPALAYCGDLFQSAGRIVVHSDAVYCSVFRDG